MQPRGRLPTHGYRDGFLVDEDDGRNAVCAVLCSSLHYSTLRPFSSQGSDSSVMGGRISAKYSSSKQRGRPVVAKKFVY